MAQAAIVPDLPPRRPSLYHWPREHAYQCLGCEELIEIRKTGYLIVDGKMQLVEIRENPEHLLIFRELYEIEHEKCHEFKDVAMAKNYREYRKKVHQRARRGATPAGQRR